MYMTENSTSLYNILSEQRCLSQRTQARLPLECDFGAPPIALKCRLPRSSSRGTCRRFSRVFSPLSLSFFLQSSFASFVCCLRVPRSMWHRKVPRCFFRPHQLLHHPALFRCPRGPLPPYPGGKNHLVHLEALSHHCHVWWGAIYNTTSQRTCPACNLPATVDPTWIRPHIRDPAVVTR